MKQFKCDLTQRATGYTKGQTKNCGNCDMSSFIFTESAPRSKKARKIVTAWQILPFLQYTLIMAFWKLVQFGSGLCKNNRNQVL